jgi:flagellar biosynthesis/type III secretory pathway M-ring protein FliF/YscJ
MEFLSKLFVQTQKHLKGLTTSQRLAVGSCAALVLIAMLWLVTWAQAPVLVPLLDQPLSAEERSSIEQRLQIERVKYEVSGDILMVPAESRHRLVAVLAQSNVLPKDISLGYAQMLEKSSPWQGREDQSRRWNLALANELAADLRHFDGVKSASVFIDKSSRSSFGSRVKPTASVSVTLEPGLQLDEVRGRAIASLVSSAVAGLDISEVSVTDQTTFTSYSVAKTDPGIATDGLKIQQQKEAHFEEKIRALLADIPNLRVAVHAELDPEWKIINESIHGKPVPTHEKTESETTKSSLPAGGPGVNPNVGVNLAATTPIDEREKSSSETDYAAAVDEKLVKSEVKAHGLKALYASINVPRSYLAAIYTKANNGAEPTDEDLDQPKGIADREIQKIRTSVMRTLALVGDEEKDRVSVEWFHDAGSIELTSVMPQPGAGDSVLSIVKAHGGKAGLGALAVMSLFMMLMMVRKVGEGPILPGEEAPKPGVLRIGRDGKQHPVDDLEMLETDAVAVGEAAVGEDLLEGKELDEQTVRMTQVVQQVSELIKEDPDASVQILQRWIDTEEA